MRTSDRGIAALIAHEGIVPGPYRDSKGVWTWGVGHTAAAGEPVPVKMPRGMPADLDATLAEVFRVFRRDLERYEDDVSRAVKTDMTQAQFDAAVSFHFNTGEIHRAKWVKTFNAGDVALAGRQIMNWTKPREIIPRRMAEQKLFRAGEYPDAPLTVWGVTSSGRVIFDPVRTLKPTEALALMRGGVRPDVEPVEPAAPWWVHLVKAIARLWK